LCYHKDKKKLNTERKRERKKRRLKEGEAGGRQESGKNLAN